MRENLINYERDQEAVLRFRRIARSVQIYSIGGEKEKSIRTHAQMSARYDNAAKALISRSEFAAVPIKPQAVGTLILTPGDFGHERLVPMEELFDPNRLAKWSEETVGLPSGYVVGLLRARIILYTHLRPEIDPVDEPVWIGMKPIIDAEGNSNIFCVEQNRMSKKQTVSTSRVGSGCKWFPYSHIMYGLYRKE